MTHTLKPTDFGGWGRKGGPGGGLTGVEFSSRCPPSVAPYTRIVAVCGINDFQNASSPEEDGWFHSDFYLFHYLFSGLGSNQIWMACVNPAYLVTKYREFVHGNRLELRRVVLDAEMLPCIQRARNIRVTSPDDLLERFLFTVRSECQLARLNKESVLVLIFGHGDPDTYGVSIGGKSDPKAAPRLTIANFNMAIRNTPNIAVIMTSCYSGGWVVKKTDDHAALNASIMAAAGPGKVSESWAKSESSGRASGSIYASALVKAAIQGQIADTEGVEDEDEIKSSLAYVGWAKFIYDVGHTEVDRLFWKHDIKFSAQNDSWGSEWKTVSGLPMADYKAKLEMLKTIPIDVANPLSNRAPNENFEASIENLSLGESGSTTLGQGFRGNFFNIVREQAIQYLKSFPGNDASGCNSHHVWFRRIAQGQVVDKDHLEYLSKILCYRMSVMKLATDLKGYLDLPIADGHLFDTWLWEQRILEEANIKGADVKKCRENYTRYENIRSAIFDAHIFDSSLPGQGLDYIKPIDYLAIAFYESGQSKAQILDGIGKLVIMKKILVGYLVKEVLDDPMVQRQNNKFFRTFSRLGNKLRSLSPSKNKGEKKGI